MALKMLYRGPSSRLETLIEKIQQNKDSNTDIYSSHTSLSFSPSLSEGAATPNSLPPHDTNVNDNNNASSENSTNFNNNKSHHQLATIEKEISATPKPTDTQTTDSGANELATKMAKSAGVPSLTPNAGTIAFASTHKTTKINGKSKLMSNAANNNGEGSYHCQFCDKSFPRLGYLKKHEQSHAEHMPFKCDYCARLFKHKRSRDRHTKLHTGDRRYRCPHCEAAFSRSDHLKIHMKTHDNQKPFQCTVCNRGYNTAAALTSHMQNHKKQQALNGNPTLTYSPRSTGSASSISSLHKRKYSPHIDVQHHQNSNHSDYAKRAVSNGSNSSILYCIYCTKSDFDTLDQLHSHIQQMHATLLREATPTAFAQSNLQLTCEFCTMKFPSIGVMFQHIRTTHIDRINSPTGYIEHFNRITNNYGAMGSPFRSASASDELLFKRKLEENLHSSPALMVKVKAEQKSRSPSGEHYASIAARNEHFGAENGVGFDGVVRKTPNRDLLEGNGRAILREHEIKQEEQNSPTDLSQKRSSSVSAVMGKENGEKSPAYETNNNNNNSGERSIAATPIAAHQSASNSKTASHSSAAGTFLCNQCTAALPNFEAFRAHLKSHLTHAGELNANSGATSTAYMCPHCGISLTNQSDYDRHCLSHYLITVTEFCCAYNCQKSFTKADDLHMHLLDAHAQNVWKCGICAELFESKVAIQVHLSVAHSNEVKTYRCSACMDAFKTESEFKSHVRARHTPSMPPPPPPPATNLQCLFCRTVCGNELEMHFHLAAHARQFRCPVCPEAFHVEFLLDRHMQTHHLTASGTSPKEATAAYKSAAATNNNNNILDYHYANAKSLYQQQQQQQQHQFASTGSKLYNPLQIEAPGAASAVSPHKSSASSLYGFSRYGEIANKHLMNLYNADVASKFYMQSEPMSLPTSIGGDRGEAGYGSEYNLRALNGNGGSKSFADARSQSSGLRTDAIACGICERNDFSSEMEAHTHRKVAHNVKTGVSLRCAYCNDNFRSRSELENHMKVAHNTSGKHKCLICDEIFPSPAVLAEHKLTHSKIGASGKCSHCSTALVDVTAFKRHMTEHGNGDLPVQCVCCRQTLSSEYEIGLHAKFHTKSLDTNEHACALCLVALPASSDAKVCEKCYKKHNFTQKYSSYAAAAAAAAAVGAVNEMNSHAKSSSSSSSHEPLAEFNCNICKKVFATTRKLQEHLIEHSFHGCDDRGFTCYICSSVFTSASGLHQHMNEHGPNSRPYDCNLCTEKFFFRTELENHLIDHEHGRVRMPAAAPLPLSAQALFQANQMNSQQIAALKTLIVKHEAVQAGEDIGGPVADNSDVDRRSNNDEDDDSQIKAEATQANDEDDEYIEIEKIGEHPNSDYDEHSNAGDSAKSHHTGIHDTDERETGDEKNQESDRLSAGDDRSMRSESP